MFDNAIFGCFIVSVPRLDKAKNLLVHKSHIENFPVRKAGVGYVGMSIKGRLKKHEMSDKK